jgi:hypothetical protein
MCVRNKKKTYTLIHPIILTQVDRDEYEDMQTEPWVESVPRLHTRTHGTKIWAAAYFLALHSRSGKHEVNQSPTG